MRSAKDVEKRVTRLERATFSLGSCEPASENPRNEGTCELSGEDHSRFTSTETQVDSDRVDEQLGGVIEAWPKLAREIREAIVAIARASAC